MPRGHPKHKAQLAFPVYVARQCEHIAVSELSARRGHQRTSLRLQGGVWFDCSQQLQATVWFVRFGNQEGPGSKRIHHNLKPQLATSCCYTRIVPVACTCACRVMSLTMQRPRTEAQLRSRHTFADAVPGRSQLTC
jgi:hypothetical protein